MKKSPFEQYWRDKNNWKFGLFYVCAEDPRVIVPKHPAWAGKTLNFAHRAAYIILFLTLVVCIVPLLFLSRSDTVRWWFGYGGIIMCVILYYYVSPYTRGDAQVSQTHKNETPTKDEII